jgi:chromosome segregation ATPase
MSINIKKYTKEQMAKMVEDAQAEVQKLRRVNAALTVQISQMNGEAITRENVIAKLKAAADGLRNKLADTEAALGRANAEVSRVTVGCRHVEEERDYMHQKWSNAEQRANYAEGHPWKNLWAWVKRKVARHE